MNTKIILGLTTAALLTTSALAYNGQGQMKHGCDNGHKHSKMMHSKNHKDRFMFLKMLKRLDLSSEQKTKVKAIVQECKKNMPNPSEAFSDASFDKKVFIKLVNERKNYKVEAKADMIEKVYAVLNASQKKDLKTMLDMKDIKRKNMMNHKQDKSCKSCKNK